jgi:DNA-binding IclR family transcriptional regulator
MGTRKSEADNSVQATRTMFEIVECLRDAEDLTVTEIANRTGYAKSTVHRHLGTLTDLEYVTEESGRYNVGLRFLELGQRARTRCEGYELAREKVEEIAEQTGERAQFLVKEHGTAVYIHRAFGERAVHTDPGIGSRVPLHATSAGKAILAELDEEELFEVVEQSPFDPITDRTITDPDELLAELEQIRDDGYSFNRQENLEGLHAVGAAVTAADGGVIGALSVSGPSYRLTDEWFEEELPMLLKGATNELELNIAHA